MIRQGDGCLNTDRLLDDAARAYVNIISKENAPFVGGIYPSRILSSWPQPASILYNNLVILRSCGGGLGQFNERISKAGVSLSRRSAGAPEFPLLTFQGRPDKSEVGLQFEDFRGYA